MNGLFIIVIAILVLFLVFLFAVIDRIYP